MPVELRPERAIVPIVRATEERPVSELLGTGFFVGTSSTLHVITAKHVIANNPLVGEEKYAIAFREDTAAKIVATRYILAPDDFDLAACVVERSHFPDAVPLAIGREDPALNDDVFCFEYSATRIECTQTGGTHVSFDPYAHKGNIVRFFKSTYPETVVTQSFLTSFPALQGASGAPILAATASRKSIAVVGMIVANVERHLIPAQIVQIEDGDSYRESTSYFLPYGKSLARSVVAQCLEKMEIPFSYAEDTEREGL